MFRPEGRSNVPYLAVIVTDGYANVDVGSIVYEASVARALGIHFVGKRLSYELLNNKYNTAK